MQKETRPASSREKPLLKRAMDAVRSNRKLEWTVYGGLALLVALLYAGTLLPKDSEIQM